MFDANGNLILDDDRYYKEIMLAKTELEKEKIKFRDQRNDYNRLIRDEARMETRFEILEELISNHGVDTFSYTPCPQISSDNDVLVMLSDLHIGEDYDNHFGRYNTEIAKERLSKYLSEIVAIKKMHNSENCYVALLGDLISGNIHASIAIRNRENVIEQVKTCADLIAVFVSELSKHFSHVYLSDVVGNHSRLQRKEDALKDERLDMLIPWYVEGSLRHIKNITVLNTKYDTTISTITIRGKEIIQVHGDYDPFSINGVSKLTMMLGFKPFMVISGHRHTPAFEDMSGVKMLRSGSLGGSGDDYTIEKRLTGSPSQTCCVINKKGQVGIYPIEFE